MKSQIAKNLLENNYNIIVDYFWVNNIKDEDLISCILTHSRDTFLPQELQSLANCDGVIYYTKDRFLLDMASVAHMLSLSKIKDENYESQVAVLGGGIGYLTAMVSEYSSHVHLIDSDGDLMKKAIDIFSTLSLSNITTHLQDINNPIGLNDIDVLFIEGSFVDVDINWLKALKVNGKIIGSQVVGNLTKFVLIEKTDNNNNFTIKHHIHNSIPILHNLVIKEKFVF